MLRICWKSQKTAAVFCWGDVGIAPYDLKSKAFSTVWGRVFNPPLHPRPLPEVLGRVGNPPLRWRIRYITAGGFPDILHSAFCILHSAFCILHSAFCILHLTVEKWPGHPDGCPGLHYLRSFLLQVKAAPAMPVRDTNNRAVHRWMLSPVLGLLSSAGADTRKVPSASPSAKTRVMVCFC